jgi:hypothetical protein|mmetsp:Transcript_1833/g.2808  ORF Transcript_1833/g.2808 Transcript_1833/m.2808 type:complete len:126 (+) Transcript_1833:7888-8265(+)
MNIEQRIYLIKELDIQRALKSQKIENLIRESAVLSATITQLITPEVIAHPLYRVRHEQTRLGPTPSKLPTHIAQIVSHGITVLGDPISEEPVAIAIPIKLTTDPLGHTNPPPSSDNEYESQSENS